MKEWFEYEYGYVNIDDQFFYLTSTGNWSEVSKIKEFSSKNKNFKGYSVVVIITIIGFILLYGLLNMLNTQSISYFFLVGAPTLLFFVYKYMKSDIGANFKINLNKITDIQFESKNCIIQFYCTHELIQQTQLINVSEKGLKILKKLKTVN